MGERGQKDEPSERTTELLAVRRECGRTGAKESERRIGEAQGELWRRSRSVARRAGEKEGDEPLESVIPSCVDCLLESADSTEAA